MMNTTDNKHGFVRSFFTAENRVLLLLIFFGLFFRYLTMANIETGGDAAGVWFTAKELLYGLPYPLSHHSARFGMVIPVYLTQLVFGTHPVVYYIAPLVFFVLQMVFLYKIAVRAYGISLGYLSVVLLILLPKMFTHAIQIKPDGFCAAYILISVYLLFKFMDTEKNPYLYLVPAAVFMFLAYLSKETSLFFLPGMALVILIMRKKLKYAIVFAAILFFLFLGETAIYYLAAGLKLGRMGIVTGSHLESGNLQALPSFWHLFKRYAEINTFEKIYFSLFFAGTCYLALRSKKIKMNIVTASMLIIPFAFLLLLTFAVKGINPAVPAMSFNPRHFFPAGAFMVFGISYAVIVLFNSIRGFNPGDDSAANEDTRDKSVKFYAGITGILSVVSFVVVIIIMPHSPLIARESFFGDHPIVATFRYHTMVNDAYAQGIPLIQEKVIAKRWKDPVDAVQVFIDKGFSQQDACEKAGVREKDYIYCLKRVKEGDYKTFKIFTNIFWDGDFSPAKFKFPEMEEVVVKNRSIGYMVKDAINKNRNFGSVYFNNGENPVMVMYEKPFRVKRMKLKEFFNNK